MKKLLVISLVAALAVATFSACGGSAPAESAAPASSEAAPAESTPEAAPAESEAAPAEAAPAGDGKTGFSVHTKISGSKPATAEAAGKAQVDTYIVLSQVGADGKITKTQFDCAQTAIPFDAAGQIPADFDLKAPQTTKVEKQDAYGMKKASQIGKEWFEQAQGLMAWAVGKTPAEVGGMKTKKVDDNHQTVPDEADLASSVTMDAGEFIEGVKTAEGQALLGNGAVAGSKSGFGTVISVGKSKSATADAAGLGQVDCVIAFATVGADGKIQELKFDNAQTKVEFNTDGTIKTDLASVIKSKQQLGADYGMIKASTIGKEWFEQADALANWCVGKTIDEVKAMKTKQVDEGHPNVPDDAELSSAVTITVQDYIAALEKAIAAAK